MIARKTKTYGVVLPHFGPYADPQMLLRVTKRIEQLGFDAVWVRDHLVYTPRPYDDPDTTHIEPFIVLGALAAVTKKIILGTATLIPHRHPIQSALLLGSLDLMAGGNRVIAGWGIGGHEEDFVPIGMGGWDRRKVIQEQIAIIRQIWKGEKAGYAGEFYKFDPLAIKPVPADPKNIPIWIGGSSKAAARRAVEFCDGWVAARIPRETVQERVQRMERMSAEKGRADRPVVSIIPYMSPAKTVEDGAKHFNLQELFKAMERLKIPPPNGTWQGMDDLQGAAIAGPPDVIIENIRKFQEIGTEHFVFDFRTRFGEFEALVEEIGGDVLPRLHREDGRKAAA